MIPVMISVGERLLAKDSVNEIAPYNIKKRAGAFNRKRKEACLESVKCLKKELFVGLSSELESL